MKFKIVTSVSIICVLAMFFGMLMFSVEDFNKEEDKEKEKLELAKTLPLEVDKYEEVNTLINQYMTAKQDVDMAKLATCVNDVSNYNEEDLKGISELVEQISGIKCYTIDGYTEDSYVVYAYYEYKVRNVDSIMPNVVMHYVCKIDGKLCVFSGNAYEVVKQYVDNTKENPEVVELINSVNTQITELQQKDESVKLLYETINSLTSGSSNKTDASAQASATASAQAADASAQASAPVSSAASAQASAPASTQTSASAKASTSTTTAATKK